LDIHGTSSEPRGFEGPFGKNVVSGLPLLKIEFGELTSYHDSCSYESYYKPRNVILGLLYYGNEPISPHKNCYSPPSPAIP
jgi:hypothetical protein